MRILTSITLFMLIILGFTGNGMAEKAALDSRKLTPDALLPIVKEVINKLSDLVKIEGSENFAPAISGMKIVKDGEAIKVSGKLAIGKDKLGNTDVVITNTGKHIQINGIFPDWSTKDSQNTDSSEGLHKCTTDFKGSNYQLLYDIQKQTVSDITLSLKELSARCANGKLDLKNASVKSKLIPTSEAGEYIVKTTLFVDKFSFDERVSNSSKIKEFYSFDQLLFGFDMGPVNIREREARIGLTYEQFWAAKTPSLAFFSDLYFLQKQPEKYLPLVEKLTTLTTYLNAVSFKDNNGIRINHSKNSKLFLDVLNLHMTVDSEDTTKVDLPEANLFMNYSRKGTFEVRSSDKIQPKALADLMRKALTAQASFVDLIQLLPQPLNLNIKGNLKSNAGEQDLKGSMSVVGFIPNIDLTITADNMVKDFNSAFSFKGTPDPEAKACLSSVASALNSLKPLAIKNSKSSGDSWVFHIKGMPVPGPVTINKKDPATLQFPEFLQVQTNCISVLQHLMAR